MFAKVSRVVTVCCFALAIGSCCSLLRAQPAQPTGFDADTVISLLELVLDADRDTAAECLRVLADKVQSGEVTQTQLAALQPRLQPLLSQAADADADKLGLDAARIAVHWNDQAAADRLRRVAFDAAADAPRRAAALAALVAVRDERLRHQLGRLLTDREQADAALRADLLGLLGRWKDDSLAQVVLECYPRLDPQMQPQAIELLTQRADWSRQLVAAVADERIAKQTLNANQLRKLVASGDAELKQRVTEIWGSIRSERNPQREQVIGQVRQLIERSAGDAVRGQAVFQRVCGQCHQIYGEGQEVGPDITRNGRASFDQLLSNVLDPSLVIGADYQARTVITVDGRVLTGLLSEDGPQRVVLKTQGGKLEIVPRDDIDELVISPLSLMPEGLEQQLKSDELVDLFAFLTLDKPPSDPQALQIPGTPAKRPSPGG